jgi:hypothetical protein
MHCHLLDDRGIYLQTSTCYSESSRVCWEETKLRHESIWLWGFLQHALHEGASSHNSVLFLRSLSQSLCTTDILYGWKCRSVLLQLLLRVVQTCLFTMKVELVADVSNLGPVVSSFSQHISFACSLPDYSVTCCLEPCHIFMNCCPTWNRHIRRCSS